MSWFRKNILNSQVIKAKSDKIQKRALRDAKKKIKRGVLIDSHSLALYLQTIDARYASLKADVNNSTRVANYEKVRAAKMAETRQLIDFFSQDNAELARLNQIVIKKAERAQRIDDLRQEKLSAVDISKQRDSFEALTREENEDASK